MNLLILGASARAAAYSAVRAGFRPCAGDLFTDSDLIAIGPARRVEPGAYPEGLLDIALDSPPGPFLYTGAIENHPELVDRIAETRPLWGNRGETIRAVRNPFEVAQVLRRAGLPCPEVRSGPEGLPGDGSWLVKPLASAAGRRIWPWTQGIKAPQDVYYQQRIAGPSHSAVFVATGGGARRLGVSLQLHGCPGAPFGYLGSIGPWPIRRDAGHLLDRMGQVLAVMFGLRGLFGVDFLLWDGAPWPVEVNPRYPASVEVLECALGKSFLAEHAEAFEPDPARRPEPVPSPEPFPYRRFVGKIVVYSRAAGRFPTNQPESIECPQPYEVPGTADRPAAGTSFKAGDPVLTVLAAAFGPENCRLELRRRHAHWQAVLQKCADSAQGQGR